MHVEGLGVLGGQDDEVCTVCDRSLYIYQLLTTLRLRTRPFIVLEELLEPSSLSSKQLQVVAKSR